MLIDLLNKNTKGKKGIGAVDNIPSQFPKHMTKVLENTAFAQTSIIPNEKYKPKFKTEKEKALLIKLKIDEKKPDSDTGRIVKKELILPESTKSQNKPIVVE